MQRVLQYIVTIDKQLEAYIMDELSKLFHIHEYILNNSKQNIKINIDNSYALQMSYKYIQERNF